MKTQKFEYVQGSTTLEGFLAFNERVRTKSPGVILVHEWLGLNDHVMTRAKALAKLGYVALAVDIYGKGVRPKNAAEGAATMGKYKNNRPLLRERVLAGLNALKKHPRVNPKKTAAIGYCFGGLTVLELARSGADVKGVVSFHGALDTPNPEDAKQIKAKVLACHGANDPLVTQEAVLAFQKEMRDAKVDWQFISYGNAMHSFTNKKANSPESGLLYNKSADERSWRAMLQFFEEIF